MRSRGRRLSVSRPSCRCGSPDPGSNASTALPRRRGPNRTCSTPAGIWVRPSPGCAKLPELASGPHNTLPCAVSARATLSSPVMRLSSASWLSEASGRAPRRFSHARKAGGPGVHTQYCICGCALLRKPRREAWPKSRCSRVRPLALLQGSRELRLGRRENLNHRFAIRRRQCSILGRVLLARQDPDEARIDIVPGIDRQRIKRIRVDEKAAGVLEQPGPQIQLAERPPVPIARSTRLKPFVEPGVARELALVAGIADEQHLIHQRVHLVLDLFA